MLANDSIVCIVPPKHPWTQKKAVSLQELTHEPFICREEGSGTWAAVQKVLKKKGIRLLNAKIRVSSSEAVKQSVKEGLGVSFISEWALKDDPLPVISIQNLNISRTFYIVYLKTTVKKRIIQAFTGFLKER